LVASLLIPDFHLHHFTPDRCIYTFGSSFSPDERAQPTRGAEQQPLDGFVGFEQGAVRLAQLLVV
jgi:hypothetical protein